MRDSLENIRENFKKNIGIVEKLMKFDEVIQIICLNALEKANKGLEHFDCGDHTLYNIKPIIQMMKNIRINASVRPSYEIMLNQCVVLLVSYFSSSIDDLFQVALDNKIKTKNLGKLEKEEIKLSFGQLAYDDDIVNLFMSKKDINFQDMQSISRVFEEYIGIVAIPKDKTVNNIILSQSCRHCIVHDGSTVNKKISNYLSIAKPRDLKPDLKVDDKILFDENEIKIIIDSMLKYIDLLIEKILALSH